MQSVISIVEAMGAKQGFKSLKSKNRHIISTNPANWIAGVDHDEDKNDDNISTMMKIRMIIILMMILMKSLL